MASGERNRSVRSAACRPIVALVRHFTLHAHPPGVSVRLGDGIEITLASGDTVVADASRPQGDVNVTSHAHGDHLFRNPPADLVCSDLTAALAGVRRENTPSATRETHPQVELLPAGHIPGSRAALVADEDRTYLYTGDVSTRERFYLEGFDPVAADVLVVEATYGKPTYRFPDQAETERDIVDWLTDTIGRPVVFFGYALGRAQELELLADRSARESVYVSPAIADLDAVIESALDVSFDSTVYSEEETLGPSDVLVLPSQTRNLGFVETLVEETGALQAGASGWAIEDSYRFRTGVDVAFPLSDHCDFDELLALVAAVDPDQVFTQHGFADELATHVRSELGIPARSLKRNQSTLGDF